MTKIETKRDKDPRQYVVVQVASMRKSLQHVMETWRAQTAVEAREAGRLAPEDDPDAWRLLAAYMSDVEDLARKVRELAVEKQEGA